MRRQARSFRWLILPALILLFTVVGSTRAQSVSPEMQHASELLLGKHSAEAANAVSRLIDVEKVSAVIGEVASSLSLAGGRVAQRRKIPMVSPSSTNPDVTGPSTEGPLPATGSVAALITKATGREPYFVGKPNPMMFRSALNRIEAHSESTMMIGDRMDTDVVAGIEAGLDTILVLTGSTTVEDIEKYPFRPGRVLDSIEDCIELV